MSKKQIDADQATNRVGGNHLFQILAAALLFYCNCTGNRIGFTLPYMQSDKIDLTCYQKSAPSTPIYHCKTDTACDKDLTQNFTYDNTGLVNWRVTFKEACVSDHLISVIGSCYFFGFLAGSAVFMTLSDYTGRKIMVLCGLAVQALFNALILFIPNFTFVYIYAFFLGLKMPMNCHISFMWLGQFLSEKYRSVFSTSNNGFDGLNSIWISLYFSRVGIWQYWYIGNIIEMCVVFLLVLVLLPQSPRNLIARKKFDAARKVYQTIARVNGKRMFTQRIKGQPHLDDGLQIRGSSEYQQIGSVFYSNNDKSPSSDVKTNEVAVNKRAKCIDLFRQPKNQFVLLFIVPLLWLAGDITSYGILYGINHLSGNLYTNGILMGVADFISAVSVGIISNCCGRKIAILLMWAFATVGCLAYSFLHSNVTWGYICVTLGRFGANAAFAMMFLITIESFPTAFRGTMYGVSNTLARIGGIIAPLIPSYFSNFMMIFGVVAGVSFVLSLFLKETKGLKMKDQVEKKINDKLNIIAYEDQNDYVSGQ